MRKRRNRLPVVDKSEIIDQLRTFAFAFGRERLETSGTAAVVKIKKAAVIKAFWDSQPSVEASTPRLTLANYFDLHAWAQAVQSNDLNLFNVALLQTPVQLAPTLTAKLAIDPSYSPSLIGAWTSYEY